MAQKQNFSKGTAYLDPDTSYYSDSSDFWVKVPKAGSLVGNLLGNALVVNNYSVFDMNGQGKGLLGGLFGDFRNTLAITSCFYPYMASFYSSGRTRYRLQRNPSMFPYTAEMPLARHRHFSRRFPEECLRTL